MFSVVFFMFYICVICDCVCVLKYAIYLIWPGQFSFGPDSSHLAHVFLIWLIPWPEQKMSQRGPCLAQAICWIASNNYNIHCILHLLDDFLTIDLPSSDGESTFSTMISIFNILKVPLSKNKLEGPCTCLEYLGVILDSDKMQ